MLEVQMNKIKYLKKEINYIKSESKRRDIEYLINLLPDYFFTIKASSTGKYHPKFANTISGLVKHTKAAVRIAYDLFETVRYSNYMDEEHVTNHLNKLRKYYDVSMHYGKFNQNTNILNFALRSPGIAK